ncbi:hypothetical protein D3C72_702800 [compost metagenome]
MTLALGATPATPMPLLAMAATQPAVMVPWPWPSCGGVPGLSKLAPGSRMSFRSGWLRSTPVSTTATLTVFRFLAVVQTLSTPILVRPHWSLSKGSTLEPSWRGRTLTVVALKGSSLGSSSLSTNSTPAVAARALRVAVTLPVVSKTTIATFLICLISLTWWVFSSSAIALAEGIDLKPTMRRWARVFSLAVRAWFSEAAIWGTALWAPQPASTAATFATRTKDIIFFIVVKAASQIGVLCRG